MSRLYLLLPCPTPCGFHEEDRGSPTWSLLLIFGLLGTVFGAHPPPVRFSLALSLPGEAVVLQALSVGLSLAPSIFSL